MITGVHQASTSDWNLSLFWLRCCFILVVSVHANPTLNVVNSSFDSIPHNNNNGDFIAFIFKYTYTATRIIINQLLIKCTITRTITFPQLYSLRRNQRRRKTNEGDKFFLLLQEKKNSPTLGTGSSLSVHVCPATETRRGRTKAPRI